MTFEFLIILIIVVASGIYYLFKIKPGMDPVNRAMSLARQNRLADAIAEYKRALYNSPNDPGIHYKIADIYLRLKKYGEAVFHLNEIIRIGKYDYEVEKLDVEKKLAHAHQQTGNISEAIQAYIDILNIYPEDIEALYHVSFSILGQEEFELAQRYFNRLVKLRDSFEVYFGIGICSYQNQKFKEAAGHFEEAISLKPGSEIANLAMAFTLLNLGNYKEAITYTKKITDHTARDNVKFISLRLLGFLLILAGKDEESVGIMENLLALAKKMELEEEYKLALYDLGFACLKAGKKNKAHEYWNELQKKDDDFKKIKQLYTLLSNEINTRGNEGTDEFQVFAVDSADEWLAGAFPVDFLWEICGLKSAKKFDIKNMLVTTKVMPGREEAAPESSSEGHDYTDRLEKYCSLNTEHFRIISNRMVGKLGYKVEEILPTYRDADGVDFLASSEGQKILVSVRRWRGTKVGEISLRNFAQAINDSKVSKGIFITTAELTDAAKKGLKNLSKVSIIYPAEVNNLLRGLIQL